ncbi:MAG: glycine cleavage system protein H [Verrucomicrobiales bacterium]|nr:glycine cleavage system protein H [Verrucomicrobiales bacterium]
MERQRYQRGHFVTWLPTAHRYTTDHAWLVPAPDAASGRKWRVGLTAFALRLLGDLVECEFSIPPGGRVAPGDILGTLEGFKAVTDLSCAGRGVFVGGNPALADGVEVVERDPHEAGWLYEFAGEPAPGSLDFEEYCRWLDQTLDRLRAGEAWPEEPGG